MVDNTYIKLFRRIVDWEWYGDSNTMRVFIHILLNANVKPKRYKGIEIKPGQCVFGRKAWADELGITERQVRTALNHLKSTNEVTTEATNQFTVITVENWELWQVEEGKATNETTNNKSNGSQTEVKRTTTPKECKNVRIKEYTEKEIHKEKENFKPPTLEQVEAYAAEKDLKYLDPKFFMDYFTERNWIDAKGNPVKNWKLKCITHNKSEKEKHEQYENRKPYSKTERLGKGIGDIQECSEDTLRGLEKIFGD